MSRFVVASGILLVAFWAVGPDLELKRASAQLAGGAPGFGGGPGGGTQNQNGQNGGQQAQAGGILIEARGVVKPNFSKQRAPELDKRRRRALAARHLSQDVNGLSELRKVSLVRLEEACQPYAARGRHVPAEMQYLAGLQRIDYVFVDAKRNDIVLAGPAEGFAPNDVGRVVGTTTGRPPLRLDDLILALRSVHRQKSIGCSIDVRQEKLAALKRYVSRNNNATTPRRAIARYRQMARILGMQEVRIWGVPDDSHYARVLVEADYRMKRISLGLETPRIRGWRNALSLLGRRPRSLQRFWFAPWYESFGTNSDKTAFHLSGQRVQLLAQDELIDENGRRSPAPTTQVSTHRFAKQFTEKFSKLAARTPVFAQLQNLIDLAVVAALLETEQIPQRVNWDRSLFLDQDRATIAEGEAPRQVASLVNVRRRGNTVLGVLGGVTIDPARLVRRVPKQTERAEKLNTLKRTAFNDRALEANHWWWD